MTPLTIPLPRPISVNNIFTNKGSGRGRVKTDRYRTWRNAAMWAAKSAGPLRQFTGPVEITIRAPEQGVSVAMDTDNIAKGYLDVLVALRVIPDDTRQFVRRLTLEWVPLPQGEAIISEWRG